jgi:hypothetical protein
MHLSPLKILALPLLASLCACSSSSSSPAADTSTDGGVSDNTFDASTDAQDPSDSAETDGAVEGSSQQDQSSKGSGGITCDSKTMLDTGGHTACLASASGTQFKLTEPVGGSGPAYLGIYLHGDGAAAYTSNSAVKRMLTLADQTHMLLIAVLAPNKCAWWQKPDKVFAADCTSTTEDPDTTGANAQALANVLEAVRKAYDIRNDPYLYYGASGGSIFVTGEFYPRFGNKYPGAMAMNCGGATPNQSDYTWDVNNTSLRGSTKWYFTYGDKDFLADASHQSFAYFQGLGFPVDEKIIAGADHCAFDGHARALEVWTAFLGK